MANEDGPELTGEPGWVETPLPTDVGIVSYVSGEPTGERLRVRYFRDGDGRLCAKAWFGPGTQGPPGHAHGGSIAALLDETLGGATWTAGHPAVALELVARFRTMLPLGTVVVVRTEITSVEGRKIRSRGWVQGLDGTVYAEGEALFLALDPARLGTLGERARRLLASAPSDAPKDSGTS